MKKVEPSFFNSEMLIWGRHSKRLTQKEFAKILGVKQQQLSEWERGIVSPHMATFDMIHNVLGIPPEWFFRPGIPNVHNESNDFKSAEGNQWG